MSTPNPLITALSAIEAAVLQLEAQGTGRPEIAIALSIATQHQVARAMEKPQETEAFAAYPKAE